MQGVFDLCRVFLRNHAAVELKGYAPRHHIGVGAAFDHANVQVRMGNAFDPGCDQLVQRVLTIQGVQDFDCGLHGVHARVGNSGVRHLAVYCDFHLEAAVVRGDDLVAEAGCDH